jgi:formylmethanofuran dehydrogenase subunit C
MLIIKEVKMISLKKSGGKHFSLVFGIALLVLMTAVIIPGVMGSSAAVNLGSAGNYAILSESGISTTGTTSIVGDIGVSPLKATAITGFGLIMDHSGQFSTSSLVNGKVYAADYAGPTPATMTSAVSDMESAYTDALSWSPGVTELGAGNIGGMTLAPGVYKWSTGVTIPTDVTLSGGPNDVWIFQVAQGLVVSSGKHVILSGGAQAKNVYWVVGSQATLGTGSVFNGNILSKTATVITTGATLNGRALAQTAVTLDANTVINPATTAAITNAGGAAPSNSGSTTAVNLGTAGNFVILTKSGITTTGTTSIVGNIGVSPIAATGMTGFGLVMDSSNQFSKSSLVNGNVYAADYVPPTPATMTTAVSDMEAAYTDAAGRAPGVTELGAGNIGGMTIAPGVYKWSTGVTIPTDVTLAGNSNDVWIFEIAQNLGISSGQHVILSGGAQAKNVYWVVAGQTTLGTYSTFNGNILDQTAIVEKTGAVLHGRALAQTAVTLDANTVTDPTNGMSAPSNSGSATAVNLGTAGNFVILTKSGITTTGTTSIVGNIGVSPIAASSMTGFGLAMDPSKQFSRSSLVVGKVYAADYVPPTPATMTSAVSAMEAAYTTANSQAPGVTELGAGNIDGMTLAPGVYKWSTGVTIPNSVTLDAQGNTNAVWVFQIAGVLSTGANSHVILSGGAQAQNIYWVVAGNTELGANSAFNGNILDQTYIALNDGATLYGRALAQTAVTLDANTVIDPVVTVAPTNGGSATAVNLGTAGSFVILTKSGITTTGTTSIVGNIGVSPIAASSMTGFGLVMDPSDQFSRSSLVNGKVYAADYAPSTPAAMTTAVSAMEAAYTDAAGRAPDVTELGAGNIGGMTLAPGVYKWSTGVTIPTDVTLAGNSNDVWIFEIAQNLVISSGKHVTLSGGAQAKNVYWVVAGQTTLGTYSTFNGNILDQTAIVENTGATLNGRALAQTAVTLDANTVTDPTFGMSAPSNSGSATAVNLGTAGNFVILSKSGITTTGTTSIVGNIGVSPISATGMTGFGLVMDPSNQFSKSSLVNGNVYAADYVPPTPATMTTAVSDMEAAYTDAAGRAPGVTELGAGNIGGMTLAPGVYKWSTGVTIPTDVTLSGTSNDVWIFEIAQNLVISSGQHVTLSGGAQAKNVYWVVAGQTTLGTYSTFNGNILDQTAIVEKTGAVLHGRALAQSAVTLDANTVN